MKLEPSLRVLLTNSRMTGAGNVDAQTSVGVTVIGV